MHNQTTKIHSTAADNLAYSVRGRISKCEPNVINPFSFLELRKLQRLQFFSFGGKRRKEKKR